MFRADQTHKILVVDDNEVVLEVTRVALEAAGHRVVTHDRAAGCVALILQEKPDLVLMDVSMPHLSGDTIVGVLAKAHPAGDIVVLLHSSLSADILKVKAEAAGAHGFLQKTGDLYALVREVNRWLKRGSGASSGNMRSAADLGSTPSSSKQRAAAEVSWPSSGKLRAAPEYAPVSAHSPEATVVAPSSTPRPQAPTVLLVDRDMATLSTYRRHLQADEVTVEYALSGAAALRSILSDKPPDVAVCDAFMADLPGLELYRRALDSALSWRDRMILTCDARLPSVDRAFKEFKGQLLSTPVSAEALRRAVRSCLAQGSARRAHRASAT